MFAGLVSVIQAIINELLGPLGLGLSTLGLLGTILAVLIFHAPMHWIWRACFLVACLFIAAAIVGGLRGA
jgi:hypothetical protein